MKNKNETMKEIADSKKKGWQFIDTGKGVTIKKKSKKTK